MDPEWWNNEKNGKGTCLASWLKAWTRTIEVDWNISWVVEWWLRNCFKMEEDNDSASSYMEQTR